MKISIVGSGYVGLITGIGFASTGHSVIFLDVDKNKVDLINFKKPPIYEEGLEELMRKYSNKFYATTSYKNAIINSDITFITVGTPSNKDGSINLKYVKSSAKEIGSFLRLKKNFHLVVVKSTVLPGTTENIIGKIIEKESGKKAFRDFGLASNPEFLKEGSALKDFLNPDRIIIGVEDKKSKNILLELYKNFNCPKLVTNIKVAEMIKYASNSFLATKISFANEIGNICKKLKIDVYDVFKGVGLDKRINPAFFNAGLGFGGSCFPKDVKALIKMAEETGEEPRILKATIEVNEKQPLKMLELLKKHVEDLEGRKIGILGLSFKPETDDIRESRAIPIVRDLIKNKAKVIAYDPIAINNFKKLFPGIKYASSSSEVLKKCDIILIVTEWNEFKKLDYSGKIVIDGRRIKEAAKTAKIYEGVCW